MYYTIYKTTNIINGKFYIGQHKTKNINDSYMGSGTVINKAIEKYGRDNFIKEILYVFKTEDEMNNKEKELVILSENSYNITPGGKGGFTYINENYMNCGANNIMCKSEEARLKVSLAQKLLRANTEINEKYLNISRANIKLAILYNTGRKRPNQSKFLSKWNKENWKLNKEKIRDKLSDTYLIISPNNIEYTSNRLGEFCSQHNLPFTTLWSSAVNNRIVTKGRAKGWICKKIIAQ